MGFWKGFSDVAMNVITLGGHSAVQDSNDLYDRRLREHRTSVKQFERARSTFHKAVEELGEETAAAIAMIEVAQDFVQRLSYDEVSSALPNVPRFTPPDLSDVNRLITDFNAAVEAGKGAGLGLAASTGAWVLVAHLGTASTGAAIGGLAGTAAHSAILAWFGGGALAAGGGGMALGGLVVGGLLALPLLGYSAFKSYSQSSKLDSESSKAESATAENARNVLKFAELTTSVAAVQADVITLKADFTVVLQNYRAQARAIADDAAAAANTFADALVATAKAKGASA